MTTSTTTSTTIEPIRPQALRVRGARALGVVGAVVAAAGRTSPLSASLLRAAAAGHVGENLHTMVAAIITGDADGAIDAATRIGHASGWDALAGAVVTARNPYRG